MSESAEILLQLLRAALGNEGARLEGLDLGSVSGEVWKEVIDLSFEQGVAAIAVDGLQRGFAHDNDDDNQEGLEFSLDSPELEDLKYEWFGEVFAREEDYGQQTEAIRKLVKLWSAAGLDTFALKGLAYGLYYPVPEHRYSCDFDCNVRRADGSPAWAEADRIARENGIEVDGSMNKHSRFVVRGPHSLRQAQGKLGSGQVPVENHRSIVAVNGSRKDKRFDAYLQGSLCASEKSLLSDVKLYSPCWLFNALFCVAHARTHFIEEEGITLKHVLDWVLIRRAPEAASCREQFEKDIDRFGLRKFFDALDGVGDVLELRAESLDLREEGVRLMLEAILAPKDVRHYKSKFLAHLNILRMLWANRWKYRHYSDSNAFATMWGYIYGIFFDNDLPR